MKQKAALSTFSSEGIGADGGFTIAPEFTEGIMSRIAPPDCLAALCNSMPTNRNVKTMAVDESTPWGSTGVQAAWEGEAQTIGQSKPNLNDRRHLFAGHQAEEATVVKLKSSRFESNAIVSASSIWWHL